MKETTVILPVPDFESSTRAYIKHRCRREADRCIQDSYLSVVERLANNDARTRRVFDTHANALEAKLQARANLLLQDTVVRANIVGAARQDNERRMARLEKQYTSDVREAKWLAGTALFGVVCLTGLGALTAVLLSEADSKRK